MKKKQITGKDLIVNIKNVQSNTWNPKEKIEDNAHNRKVYEGIKEQIKTKSLFEAITVREISKDKYEILDGYHRWRACNELGYDVIRINNLGKIDDKLARAITLIKEQKKVELDELMVADIVGEMAKMETDLDELQSLLGYDEEELNKYIKMYEFDWDKYEPKEGDDEGKPPEEKEVKCPECGHEFIT